PVNLALALALGAALPSAPVVGGAMLVGFFAYGVSLTLFVLALRHLGAARSGAYFSIAPFFGALLALLMGEPLTLPLAAAAALMAFGIWLHLTEHHAHAHTHEALAHEHAHAHDAHHQHRHDDGADVAPGARHSHPHVHTGLTHTHAHFPDSHHRHTHD
ncbi:MAG: EamA family transporter, partial [Burkholderiaceae bacterium]|nr:EamA family transporter [Burkholderiaceae bacterium]